MLVLSRKPQQTIVLSDGVTFKLLGIERGRVQVGVSAPAGVRILRGECAGAQALGQSVSSIAASEANSATASAAA